MLAREPLEIAIVGAPLVKKEVESLRLSPSRKTATTSLAVPAGLLSALVAKEAFHNELPQPADLAHLLTSPTPLSPAHSIG